MNVAHDTETVERLRLAVMRLARRLRQQAEPGVTPSMLSALATLERTPLTLGELAEAERVAPPTMSRIVSRLEEEGLVERRSDAADRRVARIALAPGGRRLMRGNRRRKDAYLARCLRALDEEHGAHLDDCVALLERILEEPQ